MLKAYSIGVKSKKYSSLIDYEKINNNFPLLVKANSKQEAKEIAETVIRDLKEFPECFTFSVELLKANITE